MFVFRHIHKSFADKTVLEDVSLSINAGEVITLIGENGAGKTTLLKVIIGQLEPESGSIDLHEEAVGYVPQEAEAIGTIQDSFNAFTEEWKRDYVLSVVGLESVPKTRPIIDLSGGQRTRLALAKVLAGNPEPTVLLLDEPTNSLDAEGLEWLEQFIKNYSGGIVLVSHDRTFINKVTTAVVELHNGKLKRYGGNYDFYKRQKEIEYKTELEHYQSYIDERKHLEKVLRDKQSRAVRGLKNQKMRDNDKAQFDWHQNNVQRSFGGQAKALQSQPNQLEAIEKPQTRKAYKILINSDVPQAKIVLKTNNVSIAYDGRILLYSDIEIRGSERLHILGTNGSGKTTLLNIIAGLSKSSSGEVVLGHNIRYGYFSQAINELDNNLTGFGNLNVTGANATTIHREARSMGLDQNDLRKMPSELSRGQQAKLCFAKLLLGKNQLLILDEPTNHLDIPTREKIEAALKQYGGAIIFASHDKYFADSLGLSKTIDLI